MIVFCRPQLVCRLAYDISTVIVYSMKLRVEMNDIGFLNVVSCSCRPSETDILCIMM